LPTFAQNFLLGDVVYGLSRAREPYVASLPLAFKNNCMNQGAYVSCDHFNNRSWLKNAMSTVPTNTATQIQNNLDWNLGKLPGSGLPLNVNQKAELQAFYDGLLADPSRTPTRDLAMTPKQLTKKGNSELQYLQIRRACKFGIDYIITRGNTVHFVLDIPQHDAHGDDMDALSGNYMLAKDVIKKKRIGGHVPITTSELRLCYRNWGTWGPTGHLKFYQSLNEVQAPWVTSPAAWQQYDNHRQLKQAKDDYPKTWWLRQMF